MKYILQSLLDKIIPPQCTLCKSRVSTNATLCATCWQHIPFLTEPFCPVLAIPYTFTPVGIKREEWPISPQARQNPPNWHHARAATLYEDDVKKLIARYKYGKQQELAPFMARLMIAAGHDLLEKSDLIVPIPLHWTRLLTRGFNQSGLLALNISKATNIPLNTQILKRTRRTLKQADLNLKQRKQNMKGAFEITLPHASQITEKTICLIDDVLTTGATLNAAAKELKKHNPKEINVLTFARRAEAIETTF